MIHYLPHSAIDEQKWDACITNSPNRIPYALSWWLNAVCPEWEALVQDDCHSVMPLTRGHKFGFHYLYQPYFTQQLGIFSPSPVLLVTINEFLSAIPGKFKYVNIQLNSGNIVHPSDFVFSTR